jgi:chemotaxis protein CheD
MLLANGGKCSRMEAQIFGGAYHVNPSHKDIGADNFKAARQILKNKQVKIVSEDVGGELGRKIVFNTHTGEIVILKVGRLRHSDWYPYPPER